ncbi:MAG: polysaccharide biosynthesis tyrosine autokinase [Bacteroidales bacterium]|nr:polysaccharide biosynthesis tyrosine autokinase [Bacteroidales bacterium]
MNNSQVIDEQQTREEDFLKMQDWMYLCLSRWRWFLVSIVVCCGIAMWYILTKQPIYQRTATILLKEESNSRFSASNLDALFTEQGITANDSYVYNEMSVLQSPSIAMEAGKRIDYDVNYEVDGKFHRVPLYGESLPIKIMFHSMRPEDSGSLRIDLQENSFVISECSKNGLDYSKQVKGQYNAMVNTPVGRLSVIPTPSLKAFLSEHTTLYVTRSDIYSMTAAIQSNLSTGLAENKGTIIAISFRDKHPQRAEDLINTLINVYKESWVKDKNQMTVATSNFITDRLGVIERELGDVDQDISSYKSTHLLPDVNAVSNLYMEQSREYSDQLMRLNTQRSMAGFVRDYLNKDVKHDQLLPVSTGIENAKIEAQINEYNSTLMQRNNLVANSSESNPLVATYDQNLASLRNSILAGIDNLMVSLNTQISHLEQSENRTTSQIASNPNQAKYLQSVGRQQKVKEALYLFLLQKREENELSQAFTAYNTRIIAAPTGSQFPVAPVRRNILLVAFAIGLLIPIAIIYLRETLSSKLRGRKDLEHIKAPLLGEIPYVVQGKEKRWWQFWRKQPEAGTLWVVESGKRDIINEAFRVLRTNIDFLGDAQSNLAEVYMFTSFNPASGKSFLSVNTAASLAIQGKRVLVIDGDMRHRSTSGYVGSPATGLSTYLCGKENDIHKLLTQSEEISSLYVLPSGVLPPNPTELLAGPRTATLFDTLRAEFDYIFIDCPPIEVVADTRILAQYATRTIFVVRSGLLERSMIKEIDNIYMGDEYPKVSVILNGTKSRSNRYGYTYRYGYGYGYGYGYSYGSND